MGKFLRTRCPAYVGAVDKLYNDTIVDLLDGNPHPRSTVFLDQDLDARECLAQPLSQLLAGSKPHQTLRGGSVDVEMEYGHD